MTTRRPVSWFVTQRGRNFSFAVVTGSAIALTTAKFAPHSFFLDKYKEYVHNYSNGKPVELSSELNRRYEKSLELLNVSTVHRKLIAPFSVYGFDLFHAGSCNFRFGVAVGIPVNFNYKTIADIENDAVQVNQQRLDLSSEVGKKLADALILPQKVQEFAICREILMTKNYKVMFESTYPFLSIFFVYNLCQYINKKFNLYAAPVLMRSVLYSIAGLFGLGSYFLMKDVTEVYYETQADKTLTEMGPDYIEAGLIFYEKILQRNQALRELMGQEGKNKYSIYGNENFFLRQPRLALVHRKKFFEEKLKETREKHEESKLDN